MAAGCSREVQLTTAQKLEDWDVLVTTFSENYPYFGILQRRTGFDWLANREAYAERIAQTANNQEFEQKLRQIVAELRQGHTDLIEPESCGIMASLYAEVAEEYPRYARWVEVLQQPSVLRLASGRPSRQIGPGGDITPSDVETKILEADRIAYLRVGNLSHDNITPDHEGIRQFLRSVNAYPYLIIDIRDNGGGSDLYWQANIVSQLIEQPLSAVARAVTCGGDYGLTFILENERTELRPIADLPARPAYPAELRTDFRYFTEVTYAVEPDGPVGFKGDIFLLINNRVFSAAESFAIFAKDTAWATLVGQSTRGDGGASDPILLALPNSGLVVRFPAWAGLNPDGSFNGEHGTTPDIIVEPADDALQVLIERLNKDR